MGQAVGFAPQMEARIGKMIETVARALAMFGGVILSMLAVLTVISVTGRKLVFLGLAPIPGDFELVEAGCAVAVFSFLPWCQLRRGHVTVDILVNAFPARFKITLGLIGNILLTLAAGLIAWRLALGLAEKMRYGETTFILAMPVWYGYALSMIGAVFFIIVCAYTVWRSVNELAAGAEATS